MASQHIVLFPFMAQGHLIPFLALAKLIEQRKPGYTITIVNTPLNVQTLRSALPPNSNIQLHALHFNSADHGLPVGAENTDTLTHDQIPLLMHSTESLEPHFDRFISDATRADGGRPPLCIISDLSYGWTVGIAKRRGIFHAVFTTSGAFGTACSMSVWLHLPHVHAATDSSPDQLFSLQGLPDRLRFHRSQIPHLLKVGGGENPVSTLVRRQLSLCLETHTVICNTVREVEAVGVELLQEFTGHRILTIGPLLPLEPGESHRRRSGSKKPGVDAEACVKWLDSHPESSVLYVSFGSQNTIGASQMMALAMGLEASERPFIWVVRPPLEFDWNAEFGEEWLPEGFEARMGERGRGLLVRQWAPQLEILSHRSTGAFLSHCGWNSVLESLSRGVPLIGWPLASEQFYNSKMLEEELGVCIELARGVKAPLEPRDVESVIGSVLGGERGKEMKVRAEKCREMMRAAMRQEGKEKGSSLRAIDELFETAEANTGRR